tara:strand:+ start:698 stop:802 length:105 start_codon:yes stop_codon:yes gene_type:complete
MKKRKENVDYLMTQNTTNVLNQLLLAPADLGEQK